MTPDPRRGCASFTTSAADADRPLTRRRALLATGALGATTLAGCLGDSGTGDGDAGDGDSDDGGSQNSGLPPCDGDQYDDPGRAVEGSEDAAVTVEVWEDYVCPHCANLSLNVLPGIREDYVDAGDVALVHRDFPLPLTDWSYRVPNVARLVQREAGDEAFFSFTEAAFENQDDYSEDLITTLASDEGVDAEAAGSAIQERPFCEFLRSEREDGVEVGVTSTPTAVVGDQVLSGPGEEELRQAIEDAL